MNGNVHYWIVCDAVRYIKDRGSNFDKKALRIMQKAYGQEVPIQNIDYYNGTIQKIAGYESKNTDHYHDLAIYLESLLGGWTDNMKEYDGHNFTALNHFINSFIASPIRWMGYNGYHYFWSSKQDEDAEAMTGWVDYLDAEVDNENSVVFDRIYPYYINSGWSWGDNTGCDLRYTVFAPVSALAHFYYSRLINNHFVPLQVDGPNKLIVGLHLLGPVLHAIADACVPQHVRPAMGFNHQSWENYVETKAYNWAIDLDPNLVSQLLSQKPFSPWYIYTGGPLKNKFAVDWVICRIADKTRDRLSWSTGKNYSQLFYAGKDFWNNYLVGSRLLDDAKYFYNLAVAGTVHAIVRAYADLSSKGILSTNPGLLNPELMPDIQMMELSVDATPRRKEKGGVSAVLLKDVAFYKPDSFHLAAKGSRSNLHEGIAIAEGFFAMNSESLRSEKVQEALFEVEKALEIGYRSSSRRTGVRFSSVKEMQYVLSNYDLSAHFGTGTFRLPSEEETDNPELFKRYMDELDDNTYKAYLFDLANAIASLKSQADKFNPNGPEALEIAQDIASIEHLKSEALNTGNIPIMYEGEPTINQFNIVKISEVFKPEDIAEQSPITEEGQIHLGEAAIGHDIAHIIRK